MRLPARVTTPLLGVLPALLLTACGPEEFSVVPRVERAAMQVDLTQPGALARFDIDLVLEAGEGFEGEHEVRLSDFQTPGVSDGWTGLALHPAMVFTPDSDTRLRAGEVARARLTNQGFTNEELSSFCHAVEGVMVTVHVQSATVPKTIFGSFGPVDPVECVDARP